jgi:serine phosphatase RsbU (regulator of sigma subunit)
LDEDLNTESLWPKYNQLMYEESKKHLQNSSSISAKEIKAYKKYFATSLQNFGYAQNLLGNIPKALAYYDTCMKIEEEVGDKHGMSSTLNNTGIIFSSQGNIGKALENYFRALKLDEETNDKIGMAYPLDNISSVYLQQGDTAKGIEYMEKSLKLREETGDKRGWAYSLSRVGSLYSKMGNKEKALADFKKSVSLWKEVGEKRGLAIAYQNIGSTYLSKASSQNSGRDSIYTIALEYFQKSLKLNEEIKDEFGLAQIFNSIGNCYFDQNNISLAQQYGNQALKIGRELKSPNSISNAAQLLLKVYRQQQNWKQALEMHELYIRMRDSLVNKETQKSTFKQQAKYEYDKQQAVKDAEHQKELAIAEEEKKRQKIITYSIGLGLLMVILFSIFIFNRLQITRKQKLIIDQKNKSITDSINYAKRIQDSILPSKTELSKHFSDYFIFFRPRDIVSGDFYWLSDQDGKTILAIADCTGHGVPGAFMSMIGNTLLNEIVNEQKIFQPAEILNHLNEGIVNALHQESRTQDDGMDISICLFDKANHKITFAGANHAMYITQQEKIQEIKGDIYSIGSMFGKKDVAFTQKEIFIQKDSTLFFFTDGFPDQVGGTKNRKFLTRHLETLLLRISTLDFKEQEQEIIKSFDLWKESYAQLDDVLLAGIRI